MLRLLKADTDLGGQYDQFECLFFNIAAQLMPSAPNYNKLYLQNAELTVLLKHMFSGFLAQTKRISEFVCFPSLPDAGNPEYPAL